MPSRARIQPSSDNNNEDFAAELAAVSSESDDEQEPQELAPEPVYELPAPGANASEDDLRRALRQTQSMFTDVCYQLCDANIKIFKLEQEIVSLKNERRALKKANGPKSSQKLSPTPQVSSEEERIGLYARKFVVMNEYSVPPSAFTVSRPPNRRSDTTNRWLTKELALQGVTLELYEELPPDLHPMLARSASFRAMFIRKHSTFRRSIIHQFRRETIFVIYKRNPLYYSQDYDRKSLPQFRAELFFPGKDSFTVFAPILFPDRTRDMDTIFLCPRLAQMLRSILFGPKSIEKAPSDNACTYATLWGVRSVTPGAIAFVAVLAIFFHSEDTAFAPVGAKSGIQYNNLFAQYKQLIITGLLRQAPANKKWVELMTWYNAEVFGWSNSEKVAGMQHGVEASRIEEALEEDVNAGDDQWNEVSFCGDILDDDMAGTEPHRTTGTSTGPNTVTDSQSESIQPPAPARAAAALNGPSRSVHFIGQLQGGSESDDSLPDFADVALTSTPAPPRRSQSQSQQPPLPHIHLPALPPIVSSQNVRSAAAFPNPQAVVPNNPDLSDSELLMQELGLDHRHGRTHGRSQGQGQGRATRRGGGSGRGRGGRGGGVDVLASAGGVGDIGLAPPVQPAQTAQTSTCRRSSRLNS